MKTTFTLLTIFCFTIFSYSINAQNLDVDLMDIEGNEHNVQDYLDAGKPVFIYGFSDDWLSWYWYEIFEIQELYDMHGQGGSDDVIVLMFAGYGLETAADLSDIDYSLELGPGYENLSYSEDNPVPVILLSDFPDFSNFYEDPFFHAYCPQQEQFYMNDEDLSVDDYMEKLYTVCCTTLETFDPALNSHFSGNQPDCTPTEVNLVFTNESSFEITACEINVYVNGAWFDLFEMTDTVPGCSATNIVYQNDALLPGDSVIFSIAQDNDQLHNDTASAYIAPVDTVRGHLRGEIIFPQEIFYNATINTGSVNFGIGAYSNYQNNVFYEEGCQFLKAEFPITDYDMTGAHFRLTSLNPDGTVEKVLADTIGDYSTWWYLQTFNLFIEEPVAQHAWGYVFEDVNDNQVFLPDVPRIPGVQVNHDVYTTFTDADGYYEFPEITLPESISIEHDQIAWPVYTTPNAGNLTWGNYIHSFGLRSDDPVWELSATFDAGTPYMCEWGMSQGINVTNSGNQPVSGTLEFVFDDQLTLQETNPVPVDITGNTITFEIPELGYGESYNFTAHFDTVSSDLLGNLFTATYNLTGYDVDDNVIANSSQTLSDTLFCAYDPNDKYGFPLGSGPEGLIAANTPLKYRIRFQNTGNAPATNVTIVDTLPETLDWESFMPESASHDHQIQMNAETREIKWIFNGINLPDSTSDPLGSIGHLCFNIEMAALNIGDQILNQAHIFFDQNEPISTNVSVHTIADLDTSVDEKEWSFEMYPNPASNSVLMQSDELIGRIIEIIDLNGKVMIQLSAQSNDVWIQLDALSRGIYLISVAEPNSKMRKVKRLVKL